MSAAGADGAASAPRPARSVRRSLASIVLGFEVIVVFLAALVVWGLSREDPDALFPSWVALAVGGVLVLATLATIGLLRFPWAYTVGWTLQVLILLAGFLNPALFVVGLVFGGMWWYCMVVGARIDRNRTAPGGPGTETE